MLQCLSDPIIGHTLTELKAMETTNGTVSKKQPSNKFELIKVLIECCYRIITDSELYNLVYSMGRLL